MDGSIEGPVVVDESGDITLYVTADQACRAMEAVDVADGVYEVFDSHGRRLDIGHANEEVWISRGSAPTAANELLYRLRAFIGSVGSERFDVGDPREVSLEEALRAILKFQSD